MLQHQANEIAFGINLCETERFYLFLGSFLFIYFCNFPGLFKDIFQNSIFPGLFQAWILISKIQGLFQDFPGRANPEIGSKLGLTVV